MRIGLADGFERSLNNFVNRVRRVGKRGALKAATRSVRELAVYSLVACFLLQPNLAVVASSKLSEADALRNRPADAKNAKSPSAGQVDPPANAPLIGDAPARDEARLFKAPNGLPKVEAVAVKNAIENDFERSEADKRRRLVDESSAIAGSAADFKTTPSHSAIGQNGETRDTSVPAASGSLSYFSDLVKVLFGFFWNETDAPATDKTASRPLPLAPEVVVQDRAIVRHGFNINGRVEGSVQQLLGETTIFNSGSSITHDLLVPGVPSLVRNGTQTFAGIVTGSGSASPTNYQIVLNNNVELRNLITRTDPAAMPTVSAPPTSSGTQNVNVNNPGQIPTNYSSIRNLTLNSNVGIATVPPGTYNTFTANSGSGFRLGIAGTDQPAIYNFQSLTLNGQSQMQVVGPVILNLASNLNINSSVTSAGKESWLKVHISSGGITLNSNSSFYGSVTAPNGTVTINSGTQFIGGVVCDRLTINSGGLLRVLPTESSPSVTVAITSPANNSSTSASTISVSGTAASSLGVASVSVNGQPANYNAANGTWNFSGVALSLGANVITARAVDSQGAAATAQLTVTRTQPEPDNTAPVISITTPANNSTTTAESVTVSGTVSDPGANASGVASVTVNGTPAVRDIAAGTWTLVNVGLNVGNNLVTVRATDNAGNASTATANVIREPATPPDTTPPVVSIITPENGAVVYASEITVTGLAWDEGPNATGIRNVRVNGRAASYNTGNRTWTVSGITLSEGQNVIVAEAEDDAQPSPNVGRAEVTVTRQNNLPPTVGITSPANGSVVASNIVTVVGTAGSNNPDVPVTVTVNGSPAVVSGGEFAKAVNLTDGPNTITAVATNSQNQTSQASITIISDTQNPTIALQNVPGTVRPLLSYAIRAESADNQALGSVEFRVNGVRAAFLQSGPFEFTLQVPGDATPGNVYNISAIAKDAAGNTAVDSVQTVIAGPSGVSGHVFDDSTGFPIADATASLLDPPANAQTDANGEYSLVSNVSYGTVRITKAGYTVVERMFTTGAGMGLNLFDARLTGLDSQANHIGENGGTAGGDGARVQVVFAPASFGSETDVRITSVSQQGIAGVLPYGWSPVPGAVIDVRTADGSAAQNLAVPAQLNISQTANLSATVPLTLARYDEATHKWKVLAVGLTAGENGALSAQLPALGQYAFLVADVGETTPPPAIVGRELPSSVEASDTVLNNAQVSAVANPRSAVVSPNAKSAITVSASSQIKIPSGVAIETSFDEIYRLLGEQNPQVVDRLPQDFVLYSYPSATAEQPKRLGASFVAKPTRSDLTAAQLQFGKINIGIHAGRGTVSGVLISTQGGEVSSDNGATFRIEANSLSQSTSVFLSSVDPDLSGVSLPEGYQVVGAVDLNMSGASLSQTGRLSIPATAGDNGRVVVAKLITAVSVRALKVVARGVEENNRIVSATSGTGVPADVSLAGVRSGGRYLFVRIAAPFGYAAGTVRSSGNPTVNARVSADRTPFIDLTAADGKFAVLTNADNGGTNDLDAVSLAGDATGNARVVTPVQDAVASADIALASAPLSVFSIAPNNNAASVLVSSPVTVTFNKPVSPATVTRSNFTVATASGNPVVGTITMLSGNRVASFTPGGSLAFGTDYRVRVTTGVKDVYGNPLANQFTSSFTTSQIIPVENRLRPERVRIAYPDEQGLSTVTIPGGSVPEGTAITVINNNTGSTVSTVAGSGEIVLRIAAQVGDEIIILVRQPDGTVYQITQAAYRRADGATTVGANGGAIASDDGRVLLAVPRGAIEGKANIKLAVSPESEISIPRTHDMVPSEMGYAAGVKIESDGNFAQKAELHLEMAAPGSLTPGQRVVLMKPARITENNVERDVWEIVTSGKVEEGKIKTTSPPFYGVALPAASASLTALYYYAFAPVRAKVVVGKVTQAINGRPAAAVRDAIVTMASGSPTSISTKSNLRGEYALGYTTESEAERVRITNPAIAGASVEVATSPYQASDPSWTGGLFGFQTRYAAAEFPDPAGDPGNTRAVIRMEGRTLNLPAGEADSLRINGKILAGRSVELTITTTPSVQVIRGTLNVNGSNQTMLIETDTGEPGRYKTIITAGTQGAYNVSIETFTRANVAVSRATANFSFVALANPNNCPPLNGAPSILNGWTPRSGAVNVDIGTRVHIDFSEPVKSLVPGQTIRLFEVGANGNETEVAGGVTSAGLPVGANSQVCTADFEPSRGLKSDTEHRVRVTTGVTDGDGNALQQEFSSSFRTFKSLILNDPGSIPSRAFRIAAAGDYLATIESSGTYPPQGTLKVYDVSEREAPTLLASTGTSQLAIAIDMIEYEPEQELTVANDNGDTLATYRTVIAVTTTSHPNSERANNVWFYAVVDGEPVGPDITLSAPLRLIGVVSLNYPTQTPDFPASVKILGKRAYVGSASSGGFWVVDIEGAANRLAEDGLGNAWFPAVYPAGPGSGYARDRVRQKIPNILRDIIWRTYGISAMSQVVGGGSIPVVYPAPMNNGESTGKATPFNVNPNSFDNQQSFVDANSNNVEDRVMSQVPFNPAGIAIDVKAASRVALAGRTLDLAVYLSPSRFWLFDATNPAGPMQRSTIVFEDFGLPSEALALELEGKYVYVMFSDRVAVFDIGNPDAPSLSSVIAGIGAGLRRFAVRDGFVYTVGETGLRVSIGRAFASVLVRGKTEGENESEICANPVLISKSDNRMLQAAEVSFQVYGHDAPVTSKVKIIKEKVVGGQTQRSETVLSPTIEIRGAQNIIYGKAGWRSEEPIDLDASYTAVVVLDEGLGGELASRPQTVPFSPLIASVTQPFSLTYERGDTSSPGSMLGAQSVLLGSKANVTLKINGQNVQPMDCRTGEPRGSSEFPFGASAICIFRNSFPNGAVPNNGSHPFELTAVYRSGNSTYTQIETGFVQVNGLAKDIRKPGSSVVNGVELTTGNLALSVTDVSVPNRGISLNLARSYNSAGSHSFSSFGYGWEHNYQVLLSFDPATRLYRLEGGEGGNQEFQESGIGNLMKADKPYQGTLVKNADNSFDYFTKQRTRYHFRTAMDASPGEATTVGYMGNLDFIEEPNRNRISLSYDGLGRLARVTDSSNRALDFVYEQTNSAIVRGFTGETGAIACGKKNAWKLMNQRFLQGTSGKSWRIIEINGRNLGGLKFSYAYDSAGNLANVTRLVADDTISGGAAANAQWRYEYDETNGANSAAAHLLESVQGPNRASAGSHKTTYAYDLATPSAPVRRITFPEGVLNEFSYAVSGQENVPSRMATVIDGNRNPTQYVFDYSQETGFVNRTRIIAPLGAETLIDFDDYGQKKKEVDPEGLTTEYFYDERQNPTIVQASNAGATLYLTSTHFDDKFNKPDQQTVQRAEGDSLTTSYTIDQGTGNVKQVTLPNGELVRLGYTAKGDLFSTTDQYGNTTTVTEFDPYGNPKTTVLKNADGSVVRTSHKEFDARSRLVASSGTLEPTVSYVYNALDQLTRQQAGDPAGFRDTLTVDAVYKPEGQVASIERKGSGGLSYKATNAYDELNRLRSVVELVSGAPNYSQTYTYDGNSNLKTYTNRRGVTMERTYNALNFVTKETVADAQTALKTVMEVLEIDRVGSVKKYTDLYQKQVTQGYDGAHRLVSRAFPDCKEGGATCSEGLFFDGANNLIRRTDRNGKATSFAYDELNRPRTVTNPLGQKTIYTYTDALSKTEILDETRGVTETVSRDAVGRPLARSVRFGGGEYRTDYSYSGLNAIITDPRGTVTEQKLSSFGDTGESKVLAGSGQFGQEYLVAMQYSAFGSPVRMTDALNRQTTYTVDGMNRTIAANYPSPSFLGAVKETWGYDGEGLLTSHTDKRGTQMLTAYDVLGRERLVQVNNGSLVNVLDVSYDDVSATETRKDANNHTTTLLYDGVHRVKQLTNPDGKVKTLVYDGENLRQESDYKTKLTKYEYDAINRPTKVFDREEKLTSVNHADGAEYTKTVTDRRGNTLVEKYDALGRLVQVTSGGDLLAKYEYDANNNKTTMEDGEANRSEFTYNNLNRMVVAKRGGAGGSFLQTESYAYDAVGNLRVYADGRGGGVSQNFDELNHLLSRRDGENNLTTFRHDGEGLLLEAVEPCGNGGANCDAGIFKTSYAYNAFGSIASVTDANSKTWAFTYFPDGRLLKDVTDPLARKTSYEYDNLDRLKFVRQPLVPATGYGYDDNSNVTSITDANGQVQTIVPDLLDRVDTHSWRDSGGVERLKYKYSYDAEDNPYQTDETLNIGGPQRTFTEKRAFDARDRLTSTVDKFGHKVAFSYDRADNIRSISEFKSESSPTGTVTNYAYDKLNRLRTVNLPNSETVTYDWHADGLLERVTYASGMKREYGYDAADRAISIRNTVNANESQEFLYGYDANSNRKTETKKLGGSVYRTFGYKYDTLNRLAEAKETTPAPATQPAPGQQIVVNEASAIKAFEYDAVGNREKDHSQAETTPITRANNQGSVTETRGAPQLTPRQTATASFDQLNRLTGLAEADGTQNILTYDNNGNLTQTKRNNVVQQSFEHDPRNQLRRALGAGGSEIARFDYDSERKRVEKEVYGNTPQRYVYAGDKTVAEYSGASGYETPLAKYQLGADETVRGEFFNQNEGGRYYFTDALGSTTLLAGQLNGAYTGTSRTDYDSWGVASTTGGTNNSVGYTGQRLDSETGLMPLGNGERYYSPTLARFVQQDSFTGSLDLPASLNRFSYAHNNPNKYVDPTGNAIFVPILIFAAAFYVGITAVEQAKTVEKRNEEQIKQGVNPANLPDPTVTAVANNIPILPQLFNAATGQDPISGEDLSTGWRAANVAFAGLEILPFTKAGNKLLGAVGNGGSRFIKWLGIGGHNTDEVVGTATKAVKLFEESTDELGQGLKNLQGTQPSSRSAEILEQLRNNKALSQARTTADDVSEEIARGLKQADDLDPYRGLGMSDDAARVYRKRPSWRETEVDLEAELKDFGFSGQKSFKNRTEVPYGTEGSIRPDLYSKRHSLSIDLKNYDLSNRIQRSKVIKNVVEQVKVRAKHLPEGTRQGLIFDTRGQNVKQKLLDSMVNRIRHKLGDLISDDDILFMKHLEE